VGIRLSDGSEHYADYILSTADGHFTLFNLLKGKYTNSETELLFNNKKELPTSMQISLGIACDLSDQPHSIALRLNEPLIAGNKVNNHLSFKHFCYDHIISNYGKSVITSIIRTDYEYWESLYDNSELYELEKEKICRAFIKVIEERFPQTKGKIEITDVVTPVTYNRYTGVWKGSYMGWWTSTNTVIPSVLPELKNFYLAGQWTSPGGGIPTAMLTGRECIMRICNS
jgi:phytoene dehydrogenase-like protein